MTGDAALRLTRALAPTLGVRLATTPRGVAVVAPAARWLPAFAPTGRFRLPDHIDWSGTKRSRWRDARTPADLVVAYTLVIDEGGVDDIARWVDAQFVVDHWDAMLIARHRRDPWRRHLANLGYEPKPVSRGR